MSLEIKKSKKENAGNGVFTTKSYKKGEYVCFYDGEERNIQSEKDFSYSINNPYDNKVRIGFYDSVRNKDGVGQFINDYCMFDLSDNLRDDMGFYKLNNISIDYKMELYENISLDNSNVVLKENFKFLTKRDINLGEELYFNYGLDYWFSKMNLEKEEPFTKIFCLIKRNILSEKNKHFYIENEYIENNILLEGVLKIPLNGNIVKHFNLTNKSSYEIIKYFINLL